MTISARCGSSAWSCWIASSSGEQVVGRRLDAGQRPRPARRAGRRPPRLQAGLAAGLLDEDLAHRPRRGAEEVPPALPAGVLVAAPAAGTPRGPGRSAGGSGRAAAGRSAPRPAGAAPRRRPAAVPPPAASLRVPSLVSVGHECRIFTIFWPSGGTVFRLSSGRGKDSRVRHRRTPPGAMHDRQGRERKRNRQPRFLRQGGGMSPTSPTASSRLMRGCKRSDHTRGQASPRGDFP